MFFDSFVSIHNDGNEKTQDNVDEYDDEKVQIGSGEAPNHTVFSIHHAECSKHIVSVNQGEQTFRRGTDGAKFELVGTQDDPAAKYKTDVHDEETNWKTHNIWHGLTDSLYDHIVLLEESQIA